MSFLLNTKVQKSVVHIAPGPSQMDIQNAQFAQQRAILLPEHVRTLAAQHSHQFSAHTFSRVDGGLIARHFPRLRASLDRTPAHTNGRVHSTIHCVASTRSVRSPLLGVRLDSRVGQHGHLSVPARAHTAYACELRVWSKGARALQTDRVDGRASW